MAGKSVFGIKVGLVALALIMLMSTIGHAAAEKITIKAITAWPKTVFEVQNFMKFLDIVKAEVAKKCPGEFEIKYVGGPEVMPNREQVEAVRNGVVDMVFTTAGYYVSVMPEVDALNLSKMTPWEERKAGVNRYLNTLHNEKVNCFYLGHMGPGIPFTLYLTKPIKTVADLKGEKIRCSPTNIPFLKKIGAQPEVIPPPDVYTALERGVVTGVIWPAGLIRDWGWDKVVKYIVDPSFYKPVNVVLINLNTWKKLPKKVQQLLMEAEKQAEHYAVERGKDRVKKDTEAMVKAGIKFIKLSPNDSKQFLNDADSSLWDAILKKAPVAGAKLKEMFSK